MSTQRCCPHSKRISKGGKMRIKCAAIRTKGGQIFEGRSHADCYKGIIEAGITDTRNSQQGFVTDAGDFVDRVEAGEIAFKAGQTKKLRTYLMSEDLTGDWPWAKRKNGTDSPTKT